MRELNEILDKARDACSASSDTEFAKKLGLTRAAVSNYRTGVSLPSAVVCAQLSELAGVPLARLLGLVGEARAKSREEKAVWRRLATAAVVVLMAMGAYARPAVAAMQAAEASANATGVYIMRNFVLAGSAPS